MDDATTLGALRRLLLALFVVSVLGTAAELLLVEHWDGWQLVPLVSLALALVLLGGVLWWPGRARLRAFQGFMAVFVLSGIAGMALHYRAKAEFALERDPSLSGIALVREALEGSTPPVLAPGAMMALGFLGWAWTYRHPAPTKKGTAT